jgi:glycosyltransferase involved in cell wall biosynthesis
VIIASKIQVAVRAVQHKLRLLTAYDTFWPAVRRGGKLLLKGRVGDFTRKLFNELEDARVVDCVTAGRTGPPLFLAGHVLGLGGYDQVVMSVLKGLIESGVNVCRDTRACFRSQLVPTEFRPAEVRRRKSDPRLAIAPPHLLKRYRLDAATAVLTMWETESLPPNSVAQLNRCGLVIVPSTWGARSFRSSGVTVPIAVVPLGYDPLVFQPHPNPSPAGGEGRGEGVCTFGTAGALDEGGLRKNVQRVIDLFRRAFPTQTDVRLRVKTSPNSPPVNSHGDPRIDVIDTHFRPDQLADWYRSLTAYVNASAGEGFGLHMLEAMACGVPLISSTFGGVGAFFDGRAGYEVRFRPVAAWNTIYRGLWSDPDNGDIMDRMHQVRRRPEEAQRLGLAAAGRARQFRWEDTIRKLAIVLIQNGFISYRRRGSPRR